MMLNKLLLYFSIIILGIMVNFNLASRLDTNQIANNTITSMLSYAYADDHDDDGEDDGEHDDAGDHDDDGEDDGEHDDHGQDDEHGHVKKDFKSKKNKHKGKIYQY